MKKLTISILLLAVMILSITAVSAAEDVSSNPDDTQDVDVVNTAIPVTSADQKVLQASGDSEVLTDPGDKNFTTLQTEIDNSNGNLRLSSNYTRAPGENDIVISKTMFINGNGYTIDANDLGGIFKVNEGYTLMLMNVILINGNANEGGAINVEEGAEVTVSTSQFINNTAITGGAIYSEGVVTIMGSTLSGNSATDGGAIYSEGDLSLSSVDFADNNAGYGSSVMNLGTLSLANVNADENGIYNKGKITSKVKVIILNNETFTVNIYDVLLNATVTDDNGNTIIDDTLSFLVDDDEVEAVFDETSGLYQAGYTLSTGGIYTIDMVSSTGSTLDVQTGAIKCTIGTFTDLQMRINESIAAGVDLSLPYDFTYVPEIDGDALIDGIELNESIIIIGNGYTIDANGANHIFTITSAEVVLDNTAFIGAASSAIVIARDAKVNVTNSRFYGNNASGNGGAILNYGTLYVYNTNFINNSAKNGAAIYTRGKLTVDKSTFTENDAENGAILISQNVEAYVLNSKFIANVASKNAAAITVSNNANLTVKGSTFENNTVIKPNNAIFVSAGASLVLTDSVFKNNGGLDEVAIRSRGTLSLSGNNVDNFILNEGTFLSKATAIVMDNQTVIPDSDEVVLFAIVMDDNNNTIKDTSFKFVVMPNSDNITAEFDDEEGIYYASYSLPEMYKLYTVNMTSDNFADLEVLTGAFNNIRGTFTDLQTKINDAIDIGDDLVLPYDFEYVEEVDGNAFPQGIVIDGSIEIDGADFTISGNNANRIFYIAEGGSLTISDVTLYNGNGNDYGGAVFVNEGAYFDADNVLFDSNSALNGAAIYANGEGSVIVVNNSEFTDNIANVGSAILVENVDSLIVDNSVFDGTVTIDADSIATIENSTFEGDDYPIYNYGVLSLSENILDNPIYNEGFITSPVYSVVMGNETYITLDAEFPINATLTDDNDNLIFDPDFKFLINGIEVSPIGYNDGLYTGICEVGFDENIYYVSVDDESYADMDIQIGIIRNGNVGTYTDLQGKINAAIAAGNTTFVLPYNFTYTKVIDGAKFTSGVLIENGLTIIGNGSYIDGSGLARIFNIETSELVTLQDIVFKNGRSSIGGAIYLSGNLIIDDCLFESNTADDGNAIYLDEGSTAVISDSVFLNNGDETGFAISNDGDLTLSENIISNLIYNDGIINGIITVLDEETVDATYGEVITLNATFTDDNNNSIYDPNLAFLVEGVGTVEVDAYDYETGVYTATYVADFVDLRYVTVNLDYDDLEVYDGMLNISKADVVVTANATNIIRKQNETITVYLYDLFGNPLNLTVTATVFKGGELIDTHTEATVNGTFTYNITGLAIGDYLVNLVFAGTEGYNFAMNHTTFIVDEYVIPGSYMDLQRRINAAIAARNATFIFPYDFAYNAECDEDFFPEGVIIDAPIVIDGNYFSVDGKDQYRIFLLNSRDIELNNILFVNGSSALGGAVYVNGTRAVISDCIFVNNTAEYGGAIYNAVDLTIDSTVFDGNVAIEGGAVATDGDLTVTESLFINNIATGDGENGGAGAAICGMFADDFTLTIADSTFENNTAWTGEESSSWGGAIDTCFDTVIIDSEFINNTAECGGAISASFGTVEISGSNFTENKAIAGGAIYSINSDVSIAESNFTENEAIEEAGAIYNGAEGALTIESSDFIGNSATLGGAIYNDEEGELSAYAEITDSTFEDNSAENGGAIFSLSADLIISEVSFIDNIAADYGGAVCSDNGATITDSVFEGNIADVGNAIFVSGGELFLDGNFINTEEADVVVASEGVITSYLEIVILGNTTIDTTDDVVTLNATIVDDMGNLIEATGFEFIIDDEETISAEYNNETKLYEAEFEMYGPGIYYVNMTYVETEMLDTSIGIIRNIKGSYTDLQNKIDATEEGDVLVLGYNFIYNEEIDEDKFPEGVVINKSITIIGDEEDYFFDLIEISGDESYRIFYVNASNVNISGIGFTDGAAILGGAIYVDEAAENVTIYKSAFIDNAAYDGGAIYWAGDYGVLNMSMLSDNEALNNGGAIYWAGEYGSITGDADADLGITLMINNNAAIGGSLFILGDYAYIENAGFNGNASDRGGALYVSGDGVTVSNAAFAGSNATNGGAIFWEGDDGLIIKTAFIENTASGAGGAILAECKDLTIADSGFFENNAEYAGAIAWAATGEIYNVTFTNNTATEVGGAILAINDLEITDSNFTDNVAPQANAIMVYLGELSLENNIINTEEADIVLRTGAVITSDVEVTVLDNTTVEVFDYDVVLYATVIDDNGNLIDAPGFNFLINDDVVEATFNNETMLYEANYTLPEIARYPVSMNYTVMENVFVYTGIISNRYIGTYTDLQMRIIEAIVNGDDLVLPYNFTYDEVMDGDNFPNGVIIDGDLTIVGNGFTISSNSSDVNIFTIEEDSVVTISNATLTGVKGVSIDYGAVINHGDLTLNQVTIKDNTILKASYGNGAAAIFSDGNNLFINDSYIVNNSAPFEGSFAAVLLGSGGTVVINDTYFEENSANLGGAIHVMKNKDPVIINNSVFYNNVAFEGQDILSDSEVAIFDSNFTGDRGEDIPPSIVNMGSLYLFRNYVEGAVYNSAEGTLYLDSNEVTYCIVNYGTITTLTNATFLDNNTIPAQLGDSVLAYGTLTDDNGNFIWDERFNITIGDEVFSGEDLFIDVEGKIYYVNYTIEYAGLNVVSTTYDATVINIGIFDVPKANVTEFVVVVGGQESKIPYGENATVYVSLLGIEGIGLNETITVVVNDVPYVIDVIDGEAQFNVSGLEPGQYSATGLFINNRNYNDAYATGLFTILEPEAILIIEVEDTTVGEDAKVTIYFTDADGEALSGFVNVEIGDWEDVIGLYGETTFYVPGLAVGNYTAYVRFDGDEYYGRLNNTTTFKVNKVADYWFDAEAEDTPFDEQPVLVYVELPEDATGNVTVTINGTTFNATVDEGYAVIEVSGLDIGEYLDVEVAYSGDENYEPGTTTVDIYVTRADAYFDAVFDEEVITYLENATIFIDIRDGVTGNIEVYNMEDYSLVANVTVDEALEGINIANLTAGEYAFDVVYTGDDYYYGDSVILTLVVEKAIPALDIEISGDLVVDGEINITFTTPEDVDGLILITIDDIPYEFTGENGTYTVTVNNLTFGSHTVIGYLGYDSNYLDNSISESFDVDKANATIIIEVEPTVLVTGDTALITITLPEDVTNYVIVEVNGETHTEIPVDGVIEVYCTDLEAITYNIYVIYVGDDKYNGVENESSFTVGKADSIVDIELPDEVDVDEEFIVFVTVTPEGATGNYSVFIDGVDVTEEYGELIIFDGEGSFIVSGLAAGNHTIGVRYNGDENYNASELVEKIIEVNKINVTEDDVFVAGSIVDYGENSTVLFQLAFEDATGNVTITVNGTDYVFELVDGSADIVLPAFPASEYEDLAIVYSGDDKYNGYETTVDFYVNKAFVDWELVSIPDEIDVRETVGIILAWTDPENAPGKFNITVDGEEIGVFTFDEVKQGIPLDCFNTSGLYIIMVTPLKDPNYEYADAAIILVTVNTIEPEMELNVTENPVVGDVIEVTVTLPEDATGYVAVEVDGQIIELGAELQDGTATIDLGDLAKGNHTVVVTYLGDDVYSEATEMLTFEVAKANATIEIEVEPSVLVTGDDAVITITLPEDVTNYVIVDVNGETYTEIPEGGVVEIYLFDLEADTYDIFVTYVGDDKYNIAETTSNFTVGKAESTIEIEGATEVVVDEEFTVYVTVTPEGATGNYSVFIDGEDVTEEYGELIIFDGEGSFIVSGLAAGNHTIGVRYNGDENYNASDIAKYIVEVSKVNTTEIIVVIGDEIEYGEVASVIVMLPEDATGTVRVKNGDEYYFADVEDGVAIINITGLAVGEYEFDVGYVGDDKYERYDSVVSVNVTVADPDMVVVLEDNIIDYGDSTKLIIYLNESATGYIEIYAFSYEDLENILLYNITVEEAREGVLIENLTVGEYDIIANYLGDNNFDWVTDEDELIVVKINPELDIEATGDLVVDGEVNITFTTPEDVDGYITILVNGVPAEYTGANGTYTVTMNNFAAGTQTVVGYLEGDSNYNDFSVVGTFSIAKVDPTFSMLVEDIHVGDDEIIVFVLPEDATGYVVLEIGDMQSYAKVNEGVAVATISGLAEGNYTVVATYTGDDKYNTADTSGDFEVTKVSEYNMTVDPSSDDGNITVDVTLPEDATGTVTVTINGTEYNTTVENGNANVRVDNLPPGETNVTVSYTGDNKYDPKETSVIVNNTKKDVILTADVLEMYVGDGSKFTALLTDTAGNPIPNAGIKITINGKTYTYKTNSEGIAALPINLKCGSYPVYACFEGDDTYNPSENVSSRIEVYTDLRIVENKDLVKTQGGPEKFTVRALDQYGKPAGANEEVTMIINGVSYIMRTNADGYASLPINLRAGKYAITCMYGGTTVVNTIWVNAK